MEDVASRFRRTPRKKIFERHRVIKYQNTFAVRRGRDSVCPVYKVNDNRFKTVRKSAGCGKKKPHFLVILLTLLVISSAIRKKSFKG